MNSSVLKALDLMAAFSPETPRKSVAELSLELGIPKSTVHRLLRTLQARGFVEQVRRDEYSLDIGILELAQSARVNVEIRDRAANVARALAESTSESVYVAILQDYRVFYIYAVETSRRLRARTAVGDFAPLYCTSIGKAIISSWSDEERERYLDSQQLLPYTSETITDREKLVEDLQKTRSRGFSTDKQEHEMGVFCLGAPFRDSSGQVIGAISISGSDIDVTEGRKDELSPLLLDAAAQISVQLGYVANRRTML